MDIFLKKIKRIFLCTYCKILEYPTTTIFSLLQAESLYMGQYLYISLWTDFIKIWILFPFSAKYQKKWRMFETQFFNKWWTKIFKRKTMKKQSLASFDINTWYLFERKYGELILLSFQFDWERSHFAMVDIIFIYPWSYELVTCSEPKQVQFRNYLA